MSKLVSFYERFISQLVNDDQSAPLPQVDLEFLQDQNLKLRVSQQTNQLRQVHAFQQELE
jgi:uncharacterized membrane protein YqhA